MGKISINMPVSAAILLFVFSCGETIKTDEEKNETETTDSDTEIDAGTDKDTDTDSETETETAEDDTGSTDQDDAGPYDTETPGTCLETDTDPEYVAAVGCYQDYLAVAAPPLASSIPGVLSAKTVLDRIGEQLGEEDLFFQNSRKYPIHFDFASTHLSGNGLPLVTELGDFNETEYYSEDRRFVLGALNYYEGPRVWAYEIAPYDTANAAMIETAFRRIKENLWVGNKLMFHPTSDTVDVEAAKLPDDVPIVTTDELFEGITYQPLNLAGSMGQLRFFSTEDLNTEYLSFRDIAVLETIPNDLGVCSGTISAEFQTPLAHINVLAQNRGTPNMALIGAFDDPELRALEGKWVSLTVGAQEFTIAEVDKETADAWWEENKPSEIVLPEIDMSVTDLRDIEDVLDVDNSALDDALAEAIPAFGGKASHYGAFPHITAVDIPYPDAFVIPIYYYRTFMEENGFLDRVQTLTESAEFQNDPAVRELELSRLQADIMASTLAPSFEEMLIDKLRTDFPGRNRFRSSTNCEDLGGFTGAGLYDSQSGDPDDPSRPVDEAVLNAWASVWSFRAFEEREYRSISHDEVGMAVLVHRSFPDEAVNGVAITANIFDTVGMEPGYYINAQIGDTSVVLPPDGVTSDQFIYHYDMPRQPIVFISHSNMAAAGETVMTRDQVADLAESMEAIHSYFNGIYGPNTPEHFYAMDIEFKFNTDSTEPDAVPELVIKQARPYPGRGYGN